MGWYVGRDRYLYLYIKGAVMARDDEYVSCLITRCWVIIIATWDSGDAKKNVDFPEPSGPQA